MQSQLPHNLRKHKQPAGEKQFFTCGRPGYCAKNKNRQVPCDEVSAWVLSLPGPKRAIVSLLGRKPMSQKSEFGFHPFYGQWDSMEERGDKTSFQGWLDENHLDLDIIVKEHPTWDKGISREEIESIAAIVLDQISQGRTVTVIDSAGCSRTGQVAKFFRNQWFWLSEPCKQNRRTQ